MKDNLTKEERAIFQNKGWLIDKNGTLFICFCHFSSKTRNNEFSKKIEKQFSNKAPSHGLCGREECKNRYRNNTFTD